jgi:hypothetical protein
MKWFKEKSNPLQPPGTIICTDPMRTEQEGSDSSIDIKKKNLVTQEVSDLRDMREGNAKKKGKQLMSGVSGCAHGVVDTIQIVKAYPSVLFISLFVFIVLCGGGLALVYYFANDQEEEETAEALDLAIETGRWFCT